jgi:iron(III) transport system ATP-binding protein
VLLLDEPLSNLDAKLRNEMRIEMNELFHRLGITTVFVTHDQSDALAMSDTVAVMRAGNIVQQGSPRAVYSSSSNAYVADFVGVSNTLTGEIANSPNGPDDTTVVKTTAGMLSVRPTVLLLKGAITLSIRPEDIEMHEHPALAFQDKRNLIGGTVVASTFLGDRSLIVVAVGESKLRAYGRGDREFAPGTSVTLRLPPECCKMFPVGL